MFTVPRTSDTDIDGYRWIENTLEHNKVFDAEGLVASNEAFKGRVKFWTNELCAKHPHTFDIILAVRSSLHGEKFQADLK